MKRHADRTSRSSLHRPVARVIDAALEVLVVPSFTRVGYHVRRRLFGWRDLPPGALAGRTALVTGATSGIGLATALAFGRAGARVLLLGRDAGRLEAARQAVLAAGGVDVSVLLASMDDAEDVRRVAAEVRAAVERLDVLVHNAGALAEAYRRAPMGVEQTSAAQVAGPFLLTGLLLDRLAAARGRVITVSSGGAYLVPLTVSGLDPDAAAPFDGSRQYARAKRAQIALAAMWAQRTAGSGVSFHVMHPGWVDTPGVRTSLPRFHRLLGRLLRTSAEGADTIVWLATGAADAVRPGRLWLDRAPRGVHRLPGTRRAETPERRAHLWVWCEATTGWSAPLPAARTRG